MFVSVCLSVWICIGLVVSLIRLFVCHGPKWQELIDFPAAGELITPSHSPASDTIDEEIKLVPSKMITRIKGGWEREKRGRSNRKRRRKRKRGSKRPKEEIREALV